MKKAMISSGKGVVRKNEATNAAEEMEAFLAGGPAPNFSFNGDDASLAKRLSKPKVSGWDFYHQPRLRNFEVRNHAMVAPTRVWTL